MPPEGSLSAISLHKEEDKVPWAFFGRYSSRDSTTLENTERQGYLDPLSEGWGGLECLGHLDCKCWRGTTKDLTRALPWVANTQCRLQTWLLLQLASAMAAEWAEIEGEHVQSTYHNQGKKQQFPFLCRRFPRPHLQVQRHHLQPRFPSTSPDWLLGGPRFFRDM